MLQNPSIGWTDLHGATINKETIQFDKSIVGASGLSEYDGCNTAAATIGSIGDGDTLDRANGFEKIFLEVEEVHRVSPTVVLM